MKPSLNWTLLLGTIFLLSTVQCQDGILCLSCDRVARADDCNRVVLCSPHEKCYSQRLVGTNLEEFFKLGCVDKDICAQHQFAAFGYDGPGDIIGKRHLTSEKNDVNMTSHHDLVKALLTRASRSVTAMPICMQCCGKNFCNDALCGSQPPVHARRCFDCDDVLNPHDCQRTTLCNINYKCFVHRIIKTATEYRYQLGCLPPKQCDGIIHAYQNLGCAQCCSNQPYCNYFACDNYNSTDSTTIAVPTKTTDNTLPNIQIIGPRSANYNSDVTLKCETQSSGNIFYIWTFNDTRNLQQSTLPSNAQASGATLVIHGLNKNSQGLYSCYALQTDSGTNYQANATVTINFEPAKVIALDRQPSTHADTGERVTLTCKAAGWPNPLVTWYITQPGVIHQPTSGVSYNLTHHVITIDSFQPAEHVGDWQCLARNLNPTTGIQYNSSMSVTLP